MKHVSDLPELLAAIEAEPPAPAAAFVRDVMRQLAQRETVKAQVRAERGLLKHAQSVSHISDWHINSKKRYQEAVEEFESKDLFSSVTLNLVCEALDDESAICQFVQTHLGIQAAPLFEAHDIDDMNLLLQEAVKGYVHRHGFDGSVWQGKEDEALELLDLLPASVRRIYTREAASLAATLREPAIVWEGTLDSAVKGRAA